MTLAPAALYTVSENGGKAARTPGTGSGAAAPEHAEGESDMVEFKQLRYASVCAEVGSFSGAAEVLHTTQPNVSRVIRDMETELGVALFVRKGRGICLTREGERVIRIAEQILHAEEQLDILSGSKKAERFSLAAAGDRALARQFCGFCRAHEGDAVCRYLEGNADFVVQQVESYMAEIGLLTISLRQLPDFRYLLRRRRMEFLELERRSVAVSLGAGVELEAAAVDRETLKRLRFVRSADDPFSLENHVAVLFNDPELQRIFDRAVVTNSGHAMAEFLRSGYCHLNTLPAGGHRRLGGVHTVPIEGAGDSVVFGFVKREREALSPYAAEWLRGLGAPGVGGAG